MSLKPAERGTTRWSRLPLLIALVGHVGCATTYNVRASAERDLRRRAAFETGCPANQLKLIPLSSEAAVESGSPGLFGDTELETDAYRTLGVSGCGHKGTYVYVAGKGYVLNSTSEAMFTESPSGSRGNPLRYGSTPPPPPAAPPFVPPPVGMP